jgi:CrcB protein
MSEWDELMRAPEQEATGADRHHGARRAHHDPTPAEALAEAELALAPGEVPIAATPAWRARLTPHLAISGGAILGANARYLVGLWTAPWSAGFPWGTLAINLSGSLLLGFYLALVTERFTGRATTRLFVATGFCGAYTTFSTFSYETIALVQRGAVGLAALYVAASVVGGLLAVVAGTLAAHAL